MYDVVIYYFSGTGNTKKIASLYQEEFCKHNKQVLLQEITTTTAPKCEEAKMIGIAYPVHGFNAPEIVVNFVKNMQEGARKYAFIIKTSGEPLKLNNASSKELAKLLHKKGYVLGTEHYYVMPYNMVFRHSDAMAAKMWETAQERVPGKVKDLIDQKVVTIKYPIKAKIMAGVCKIERPGLRFNGRLFKVDIKKCVDCKSCIKNCPTKNISYKDGKYVFFGHCIGCARCFFNCPQDAIKIGLLNSIKVNGKYDFSANPNEAKIGKYCKKSYENYFEGKE